MIKESLDQQPETTLGSDDTIEEQASDTRQFVTFIGGNEAFAVDMAPVQEIIRLPTVVRVPLAPESLNGLANLRGKVLPIISLRRLFGFSDVAADDATRVMVVDVGQPLGFVVDRVASVIGVDPSRIEGVGSISSTVDTDLLSGLIKDAGGHAMIMILDFSRLISREFALIARAAKSAGLDGSLSASQGDDDEETSDELQLVSFQVAGQEYALAITDVQEIVQVPEAIVHVPCSQSHVLGVMTLRNRLLPLVSLRRLFVLPDKALDEKSRIVVLSIGTMSVGLAVDGVSEVLRVAKSIVEDMPTLLARDKDLAEISGICRIDEGKRLVSIITARNLFEHSVVKEALAAVSTTGVEENQESVELEEEMVDDDEQVVIFRLDKEEFGVPIANVQEIVRVPDELIHVPKAPKFVEGVINLRGSVLPVIDLRLRLGLPAVERSDRQRIMVFLIDKVRTGFIVDMVAEVLKIPKSAIEVAPQLSAEQGRLLSRMANLEKQKRMVQLLAPDQLIGAKDLAKIAAVGAELHGKAAGS